MEKTLKLHYRVWPGDPDGGDYEAEITETEAAFLEKLSLIPDRKGKEFRECIQENILLKEALTERICEKIAEYEGLCGETDEEWEEEFFSEEDFTEDGWTEEDGTDGAEAQFLLEVQWPWTAE